MNVLPIAPMPGTHVVVGAGAVGTAVAELLADAGVDVVVVTRSGSGPVRPGVRRVSADASSVDALFAAAPTAVAVYNCVNPPYNRWPELWPPMAAAFLGYAERTGAVLATVSNLYVYGPVDGPIREDLPLAGPGTKAQVRITMWTDAKAAHDAGRIRYTEVRGSDYLCSGQQSQLGDRVTPRILAGKSVQVLGSPDQPHTWTAPIDVARLLVTVANDPRGHGRAWHVPSNAPRTQREAIADLAAAAGVGTPKVSTLSPALLRIVGLVNPIVRELRETAYIMRRPYVLDDSAARATFGIEPTPWPALVAEQIDRYVSGSSRADTAAQPVR